MRNISYIRKLHKRVMHEEKAAASMRAIMAEDRYVKKTYYNELNLVCESCFSDPN